MNARKARERRRIAEALSNADDTDRRAIQEEYEARVPLHVRDQIDAVARDIQARTADWQNVDRAQVRDAMKARINDLVASFVVGDISCCEHIRADRPEPFFLALWAPGRVVCGRCRDRLKLSESDPEDRTCDLCRSHCPEGVFPGVVVMGPLIVLAGICRQCKDGTSS